MKIDLKSLIYSKLKQKYNFVWRSEIYDDRNNKQGGNKLRTYRLFKDNISLEKYLLILNGAVAIIRQSDSPIVRQML